jgi:hypothetical protein
VNGDGRTDQYIDVWNELSELGAELAPLQPTTIKSGWGMGTPPEGPVGRYLAAMTHLRAGSTMPINCSRSATDLVETLRTLLASFGSPATVEWASGAQSPETTAGVLLGTLQGIVHVDDGINGWHLRPETWNGVVELGPIIEALELGAAGCRLSPDGWVLYRTTPAVEQAVDALLQEAAASFVALAAELLDAYRPHGFFADLEPSKGSAPSVLAQRLVQRFGYSLDLAQTPLTERQLLATDQSRMWWIDDAEHAEHPGAATLQILASWGRISQGALRVDGASVTRSGFDYTLTADVNGVPVAVTERFDDWLPTAALQRAINPILEPYCVVAFPGPGHEQFATVATPALRRVFDERDVTMLAEFDWHP